MTAARSFAAASWTSRRPPPNRSASPEKASRRSRSTSSKLAQDSLPASRTGLSKTAAASFRTYCTSSQGLTFAFARERAYGASKTRVNALKPRRSGARRRLLRPTALTHGAQARPLGSVSKFPREPKNETPERQNRNLPEHQK